MRRCTVAGSCRFLSTLSLRRATPATRAASTPTGFLSTLSLRRATILTALLIQPTRFLSTLSLRRATCMDITSNFQHAFLSTLSLRRATITAGAGTMISPNFYPRSPCGERHQQKCRDGKAYVYFYPRSPCGERRRRSVKLFRQNYISIHALLAESDRRRLW